MAGVGDAGRDVAGNVAPLSSTERSRRHRERKRRERAERAGSGISGDGTWRPVFAGQREPFAAGNQLSVRHGAFSARLTGPMAEAIAAELLADPGTPDYVREPSYREAVLAWAQATAECRRLRARWDELDRLDAEEALDVSLSEVTDTTEEESREGSGDLRRVSRSRQRESLSRAMHRAEVRARSLRADLGLTPVSRVKMGKFLAAAQFDLARYFAQMDAEERAAGGGG